MTSLRRLHHAVRTRLANERGSVVASMAFTVFTALTLTAIVASVIASLAATTSTTSQAALNVKASQSQDAYVNALIHRTPVPGDRTCSGVLCTQITAGSTTDGVQRLTIEGQIGDKTPSSRTSTLRQTKPTMISGYDSLGNPVWSSQGDSTPYRFTSLTSRSNSSCAIDGAGAAWCWGANDQGQLGDGTTNTRTAPVKVQGSATFTALTAAGNTFCGLADDGKAWCWGDNDHGQLGTGSTTTGTDSTTPVTPTGDHRFSALFAGPTTTCGIDTDKKTWCWGQNPGNATPDPAAEPTAVAGSHEFTTLALDASTACGLDADGKIFCWSNATTGRTGVDPAPAQGTPTEVTGGRTYTAVKAANEDRADVPSLLCAIDTGKKAWCWGNNDAGQLGNGSTAESLVPSAVTGNHDFTTLTVSPSAVCGLDAGGHAWCWGDNAQGQLGIGSTSDAKDPAAVTPDTTYTLITAATGNSGSFCALTSDGAARCWGANAYGQSREGSTAPVTSPNPLGSFKALRSLSTGSGFSCVTDARNETSCWGQNDVGQTGNGASTATAAPAPAARQPFTPLPFTGYQKGGK
ncbi:regulator of chromosome condensation RCC1 (plasmid) [Pseudarthrobacter chlorophenolicus A6]|uniref:Regulator of chromosome condensation RCC1 n=1 Tax=Pseudarthrobacter chlorophenolicus (strain ATCC 700700 / DSM 12829 / CIP 107037 / JCM 12360 / KCTC 9906 / NCIMB 13794 / A6) TaxID=452863 RepID=B8HI46_PSECP|nr:chromosome condensation regulator RCC1 [Pseudarthrobacter chlorophenolicus]ACL42093.1 regulator of chromosome condensation RCC1 [Pseudarthrobacter chlorophenolicus A6]SDQ13332.1 Alpha-tubulin suppressor [Pseudarthrobacter chlorophenolicus]